MNEPNQALIEFLKQNHYRFEGGIYLAPHNKPENAEFEKQYLAVRQKEGRVYSDEMLCALPSVPKNHPLSAEWAIRRKSAVRLISYLRKFNRSLQVLEIGCGNGWLTHYLAEHLPETAFAGLDINKTELKQASRTFRSTKNTTWIYADVMKDILPEGAFDIVIFAASIQYFPDLDAILERASAILKPGGEIHILDSHFYGDNEMDAARQRTLSYYSGLGYAGMAANYFHHATGILESAKFTVEKMNKTRTWPDSGILRKIMGYDEFEWYRIKKKDN
jgi:ubiquinone/menaquinone biosynthesis C-methylase UbiE